jgi:hypothetical protein
LLVVDSVPAQWLFSDTESGHVSRQSAGCVSTCYKETWGRFNGCTPLDSSEITTRSLSRRECVAVHGCARGPKHPLPTIRQPFGAKTVGLGGNDLLLKHNSKDLLDIATVASPCNSGQGLCSRAERFCSYYYIDLTILFARVIVRHLVSPRTA